MWVVCAHMHIHRTLGSQFSPSNMQVLGVKVRSSVLKAGALPTELSHCSPTYNFFVTLLISTIYKFQWFDGHRQFQEILRQADP